MVNGCVSQTAQALAGQQILLVEDCSDQGQLYLQFLELAGAEVALRTDGQMAIDSVKEAPTLYRAVVLDYLMRKIDGINVTRKLRSTGYEGAILGMTAYSTDMLKQSWFQAGCNSVLEKPLEKTEFVDAVLRAIRAAE